MKLNGIEKIDESKGRFIVLCDYGCEGLGILGQNDNLEAAVRTALGHPGGSCAIVELVEVCHV